MDLERVTVTLPAELLRDIDQREENRSRFITEAVRNELERRRSLELQRSLENPPPETREFADPGFAEWARSLPQEDESLVDLDAGTAVHWSPGEGWVENRE